MLKMLVVAQFLPMPDREAGMLRFSRLLSILAGRYELHYYPCKIADQVTKFGIRALARHEDVLHDRGIVIHYGPRDALNRLLHQHRFNIVLFEHHYFATPYIDEIRHFQRHAKIVIDTIDVGYENMLSRARASGQPADFAKAGRIKRIELSAYRDCDVVIAISDQDKAVLALDDAGLNVEVIPLILEARDPVLARDGASCDLLFVGNLEYTANIDAIRFFCASVFPSIKREIPYAKLRIVGNAPSEAVKKLASQDIEVTGYVADLEPFYERSDISIAPLTWGGGLKSKIAEAMSRGLPVVATTTGIAGFGLRPGDNVVLADTPEEFSSGVIMLHRDREFYERIRMNGWRFVEANFTGKAINGRIDSVFNAIERSTVRSLSLRKRLKQGLADALERHILWRFSGDRG
jgi:O-antigen biosynthesis protein